MPTKNNYYKVQLEKAHISINRLLGEFIQVDIDDSNRDLLVAIQYLKDAGRALNSVENILYVLGII